ncbi:hypothetical protein B0H13DRAFT_1989904, partial [Mycena leptocephala]
MILVGGKYRYIFKDILLFSLMTSLSSQLCLLACFEISGLDSEHSMCGSAVFCASPGKFGILERRLPQLSKSSLRSCRN